ncbi:hypothetical protein BC835DRAFT_648554 [Cytidiella melzeri]|nr:hypothetical protein BC835DRAFT_648554 [Cytidiella melzeri]
MLMYGLEQTRATIGPAAESGITDQEIKDTLYHFYFDIDQSVNWLLEEQSRKHAAQERKVLHRSTMEFELVRRPEDGKPLPSLPGHGDEGGLQTSQIVLPVHTSDSGRSNVPLVRLGPEDSDDFFYSTSEEDERYRGDLSPITERTELTEYSRDWPLPAEMPVVEDDFPMSSAASTSDYGQFIERGQVDDPNFIPPSPSLSALQRLSILEPPPTASSTGSRTPTQEAVDLPPITPGIPVELPSVLSKPSLRSLVQKSDSKSSLSTIRATAAAPRSPQQTQAPVGNDANRPKSKLSALASSRSSVSSRSSALSTIKAGSVATYPHLRPSSDSVMLPDDTRSSVTSSSSMSSHVRRAIETALQLEEVGSTPRAKTRDLAEPVSRAISGMKAPISKALPPVVTSSVKPPSANPSSPLLPSQPSDPQSPAASEHKPRVSKLAQLAQAKAQQSQGQGSWMPKPKRPASETPGLMIQNSHTEYLTPIANGPTATTAITTTYQSLASLARPSRSDPAAKDTVHMFSAKHARAPVESKSSKLVMKSQKGHKSLEPEELGPVPDDALSALDLPMFNPRNLQSPKSSRAHTKESVRAREHREVVEKPRRRSHKRNEVPPPSHSGPFLKGFAFDVPSPDDVVSSARRGTSLAHRSSSTTTPVPPSTASVSSSRTSNPSRS